MSGTEPAPDGRAAERTALAWRRTALAATVVALLAARLSADTVAGLDGPRAVMAGLAGCLATLGSAAIVAVAYRRNHPSRRSRPAGPELPLSALATVMYALLGVILVVLGGR